MNSQNVNVVVMTPKVRKSVGVALLLTLLFGPLGMLYSTGWGAFIMFVLCLWLGLMTFGIALIVLWPICMVWAAVAAKRSA